MFESPYFFAKNWAIINCINSSKKLKKVVDNRKSLWYSNLAVAKIAKNIDN